MDVSNFPKSAPTSSNVKIAPEHTEAPNNASGNTASERNESDVPDIKTSLLPEYVGTNTMTDIPLVCGTDPINLESDPAHHLDTVGMPGAVNDDTKVYPNDDNPEHNLLLSAYPWTKPACVHLCRISPETIGKWSLKPVQPDVETPPPLTPIITQSKGYELRSKIKQKYPVNPAHIKQELDVQTTNEEDVSICLICLINHHFSISL